MIPEHLRKELAGATGVTDNQEISELAREVEFHICDVQRVFAGTQAERSNCLARIIKLCTLAKADLDGVVGAVMHDLKQEYLPDFWALADSRQRLISSAEMCTIPLGELRAACEAELSLLHPRSDERYLDTVESKATLARRLIPVFDKYYRRRRKGRKSKLVSDRTRFVRAAFETAGIQTIPESDEQINKGYIIPALRMYRKIAARTREVARSLPSPPGES